MPKECRFGKSVLPLNVTYTETGVPVIYVSGTESLIADCVNYLGNPKITFDQIMVEELSAVSVNVSGSLPTDFKGTVSIAVWFTETKVMWSVLLEPGDGSSPEWRFAVTKRH